MTAANNGLPSKYSREMVKYGKKLGWYIHRQNKGHVILRHPNGCQYTVSGTPGSARATTQTKIDLKRMADETQEMQ